MNWKNKIGLIFIIFLLVSVVSGEVQTLGTFKKNKEVNLIQIGVGFISCNITSILYPNSSKIGIGEVEMNKNSNYYNYTLSSNYTSTLGQYIVNGFCTNGTDDVVWSYDFEITPSGFNITESQGLSSTGLIISIILIAGLFMFVGYNFLKTDKTFPIGLFFLIISLLLNVYALHLGYIYTRDIIYPLSAEGVQFKIYFGVMWGLIAIIFIAMLYLILKILKEFRERKSLIKYGEGWNPKTKQYEY